MVLRRRQVVVSVSWLFGKRIFLGSLLAHLFRLDEICLLGHIIRVLVHILQHAHVFRVPFVEINIILILETRGPFINRVLVSSWRFRLDIRNITSKPHSNILTIVIGSIVWSPLILQRYFRNAIWTHCSFLEFNIGLTFIFLFLNGIQLFQCVDVISIKVILFLFNCGIGIKVHKFVLTTFRFLVSIDKFNKIDTS